MEHAARVLRVVIVIHRASTIFFRQKLFDLPIALFGTNTELEILFSDGVPILWRALVYRLYCTVDNPCLCAHLVDHHHGQKVAYRCKEQSIQVMLHAIADTVTEYVKDDLTYYKKEDPKRNITKRPSIL